MIQKIREIIARNKFIFNRGYTYIGMLGVGFLVASELQSRLPYSIPLYILFPVGVFGIWLVGIIDLKGGLFGAEADFGTKNNPFWKEYKKDLVKKR